MKSSRVGQLTGDRCVTNDGYLARFRVFTIILEFFASYPHVDSGLEVGGIREGLSRTQKIPHHTDLEVTAKIFTLILLRS